MFSNYLIPLVHDSPIMQRRNFGIFKFPNLRIFELSILKFVDQRDERRYKIPEVATLGEKREKKERHPTASDEKNLKTRIDQAHKFSTL